MLALIALCFAFDTQPIEVASHARLEPPPSADSTIGLPAADHLARIAITFDFPENFMSPTTAILEALLVIKIVPDAELDEDTPLELYCIPLTASPTGLDAFTEISEDLLSVSEAGAYDPETGTVFFEIAHMLQRAAIGDFAFHGVILVPAKGCGTFRITHAEYAIDLRVAYAIGKREAEE